jgi:hypothetical protein
MESGRRRVPNTPIPNTPSPQYPITPVESENLLSEPASAGIVLLAPIGVRTSREVISQWIAGSPETFFENGMLKDEPAQTLLRG